MPTIQTSSQRACPLSAVFIRAPRFVALGPGVSVLARDAADPIAVAAPGLLATTLHPELGDDPHFHRIFVSDRIWSPLENAAVAQRSA